MGMMPLRGVKWSLEGPVRLGATARAAREACSAVTVCARAAGGW